MGQPRGLVNVTYYRRHIRQVEADADGAWPERSLSTPDVLKDIDAAAVSYRFDQPGGGVFRRGAWSLGLWLSSGLPDVQLGPVGDALLPWSEIGPISLAPADAPLRWKARGGYLRGVVCRYSPEVFKDLTGLKSGDEYDMKAWLAIGRSGGTRLQATLAAIAEELAAPGAHSALMIESLSIQAAIEVGRMFREVRNQVIAGGLAPWQLHRVRDLVEKLADGSARSEQLAHSCGVSPRQLSRGFKQSTGKTLHEYIEAFRLERAQTMLTQSGKSIQGIAKKLGFAHASGFSIAFKRATGQTPRVFRQRILRPEA